MCGLFTPGSVLTYNSKRDFFTRIFTKIIPPGIPLIEVARLCNMEVYGSMAAPLAEKSCFVKLQLFVL